MVVSVARSRLGAVRVEEGLGLVTYTAHVPRRAPDDVPPKPADLRVPPREAPAIERVAAELDLAARPPAEVVKTLRAYFLGRFSYSRYLIGMRPGRTALEDFLLTQPRRPLRVLRQRDRAAAPAGRDSRAIHRRLRRPRVERDRAALDRAGPRRSRLGAWRGSTARGWRSTPRRPSGSRSRAERIRCGARPATCGSGARSSSRDGAGASDGTAWPAISAGCCCR